MGSSAGQCDEVHDEDPTHRTNRVFISYSRSEFYFAEQLAASMRRHGLVVWFDVHELVAGTDWSSAIDRAIAECDTFVLVASRSALASPYVQRERELAAELDRPCVAVLPHRLARSSLPGIPTYDLTSSFRRGVDQLASDLLSGQRRGRRRRVPLPFSAAACVVALAPAWCTMFAVVLGAAFATTVAGRETDLLSDAADMDRAVAISASTIVLIGAWSTYVCWSFSMRRVTWLSLRGFQFLIPVTTFLAVGFVELLAEYVTTDPLGRALGTTSEELILGDAPIWLWMGVALTSIAAAIATPYAAGVCRHLKTGVAPNRVRRRHVGAPPPRASNRAAHTYRLTTADDDLRVADEVRSALSVAGMSERDDGEVDRQIVVISDRTPTDWLSMDTFRNPVAVVATSVALPIRGVLQQFQWVDYRRRRRRTLAALGRDLTTSGADDETRSLRDLPERLQQVRLPSWVTVVVYVIISTATLATVVAAYPLEQRVLTAQAGDIWPVVLCLPIAVGLVVLANLVRRRRVTTGRLVAAVALSWIGLAAFGLDDGARAALPSSDSETSIPPSVAYVMVSALIFALGWRSLRRWLPRRVHSVNVNQPTLGVASGSWPWRVAIVPLSVGLLAATNITDPVGAAPTDIDALTREAESLCPDRAAIGALLMPLAAANSAVDLATSETIRSAVEGRIEMIASVTGGLDRFEPSGNWGADIKMRLIAAYERVALADQAFLDDRLDFSPLAGAYDELALVFVDFNEPFC